jgi:hypothetical protein
LALTFHIGGVNQQFLTMPGDFIEVSGAEVIPGDGLPTVGGHRPPTARDATTTQIHNETGLADES